MVFLNLSSLKYYKRDKARNIINIVVFSGHWKSKKSLLKQTSSMKICLTSLAPTKIGALAWFWHYILGSAETLENVGFYFLNKPIGRSFDLILASNPSLTI